ncbi:hypothetical protein FRACYDRAFT_233430 [Fragilariopsis cylindrus CCMP1102]|uniref:Uncharacterized protein n=1 Tax=Fragilariopsis cylindrus CCMP1102 TaxID=635003 RepID=A0A1E7FYP1_9STRA|nr:hypothetical protein FRACYDRAFT_233430 [Fragilariopsis cylindrus CCMP1102]|eukprot:OEU23258.1 hypothetical protein FRACYDRAFT_233430 [Fragilariopsis cylindrus CCMP1102]
MSSSNITATAAAEACRLVSLADWFSSNFTLSSRSSSMRNDGEFAVGKLQSIQQTNELFAIAESKCIGYINAYNIAAGKTWNMDGAYTLAAILARTDNFTSIARLNLCNNDCYVAEAGSPGCLYGQALVPLIGQISQSHVCSVDWSGMDNAWNELQICAATAVFDSNDHYNDIQNQDENALVDGFQEQRDKSVKCAITACRYHPTKSESIQLTPPGGGRRGGVVIIVVSSLMMLFLLA